MGSFVVCYATSLLNLMLNRDIKWLTCKSHVQAIKDSVPTSDGFDYAHRGPRDGWSHFDDANGRIRRYFGEIWKSLISVGSRTWEKTETTVFYNPHVHIISTVTFIAIVTIVIVIDISIDMAICILISIVPARISTSWLTHRPTYDVWECAELKLIRILKFGFENRGWFGGQEDLLRVLRQSSLSTNILLGDNHHPAKQEQRWSIRQTSLQCFDCFKTLKSTQ